MAWQKFEYCEQDTNFPTKIFIIDEYAGFLGSQQDIKARRLADKVQSNISQIARLGRSQRIHLIICTQSPTADLFGVDLKGNMAHRLICGRVTDAISNIVLGTEQGATIPARPGSCLDWNLNTDDPVQFQSYFVDKADEVMELGTVLAEDETEDEIKEEQEAIQEPQEEEGGLTPTKDEGKETPETEQKAENEAKKATRTPDSLQLFDSTDEEESKPSSMDTTQPKKAGKFALKATSTSQRAPDELKPIQAAKPSPKPVSESSDTPKSVSRFKAHSTST